MTHLDTEFVVRSLDQGLVRGPCLELGVGLEGNNCKKMLVDRGIEYFGTDIIAGRDVDFIIDFEHSEADIKKSVSAAGKLNSALVLNVLEHTFNPIQVLDNVMSLLADGGNCLISTPTVFCLHDYPIDCWRIMPTFYKEYARRRGHEIVGDSLQFLGYGPVSKYIQGKQVQFPPCGNGTWKDSYSRLIHKFFRTWGRWIHYPDGICTGVVIKKRG